MEVGLLERQEVQKAVDKWCVCTEDVPKET